MKDFFVRVAICLVGYSDSGALDGLPMKVGTKSILFGVHQFLWHPITVGLAWRHLYGAWPDRYEWIAIFCHDLGYWGKPNMDGAEGKTHPEAGAAWAKRFAKWMFRFTGSTLYGDSKYHEGVTHDLSLYHSREYCKLHGQKPSRLYAADKFCCYYDPAWFYLLRAHLSGEIHEYRANAVGLIPDTFTMRDWFRWYRLNVLWRKEIQDLLAQRQSSRSCLFPF
jgi:hypothetical protein